MDLTQILLLVITALGVLAAVLLVLLLRKTGAAKPQALADDISRQVNDAAAAQLRELQRDLNVRDEAVRGAVSAAARQTDDKLAALTNRTYESQLQTAKALGDMQEAIGAAGRRQTEAMTAAVEKLQISNEKKLEQMRATVDEKLTATLTDRLDASFKTVSDQLGNVYKSLGEMQEISGGITALNRVLAGVKTRGNWAETQLEGILDQILPGMFVKNYSPAGAGEVVEFAVKIPAADGGEVTYLPIDSKFPMEDYLRLCAASDAADAEGMKAARKALEARVLQQAKTVSKYIQPPNTTPFAVLYLATDSLYAEIVSSKENVADIMHDKYHVLPAGPSTVTALLSSLAMGFRSVALNNKAGEVMALLATAKAQYEKFGDALARAKKKIDEAGRSLDDAQHRNDVIVKKLRTVEAPEDDSALLPEEDAYT